MLIRCGSKSNKYEMKLMTIIGSIELSLRSQILVTVAKSSVFHLGGSRVSSNQIISPEYQDIQEGVGGFRGGGKPLRSPSSTYDLHLTVMSVS